MPLLVSGLAAVRPGFRIVASAAGIASLPRFLLVILFVLVAHSVLHVVPKDLITRDDADQFVFGQALALGYHEQPPLYSWLVWVAFRVAGSSVVTYAAFKTLVLAALFHAAWIAAKEVVTDPRWHLTAAAGAVFIPSLAWHALTYLTHSNFLLIACYWTITLALRLGRLGRTRDYAALGVVVGLGMLSKYNFVHFAASLCVAGLTLPSYRRRLLDSRIAISVVVAVVLFLPHAVWLADQWSEVWPALARKVDSERNRIDLARTFAARLQLPLNLLLLVMPLILVVRWVAPECLRGSSSNPEAVTLLRRAFAIGVLVLAVFAFGGAGRIHERWLIPLMVVLPLAVFAKATSSPRRGELAVILAAMLLVIGHAVKVSMGGWGAFLATDAPELEVIAEAAGPNGVIVAETRALAGALAIRFPERRVLCGNLPVYRPWPPDHGVWVGYTWDWQPVSLLKLSAPRSPGQSVTLLYQPLQGKKIAAIGE